MRVVDETSFDQLLLETDGLVVVDFYADWCGPCRVLGPVLESVQGRYPQIPFVKVDSDKSPRLSQAFGVRSLPTVLVLRTMAEQQNADVVAVSVGVKPEAYWVKTIDDALAPAAGMFSWITRLFSKD